jgi:hypothetical protein
MAALGNPRRLCFWWNAENKMLLISAADSESPQAIALPPHCFVGGIKVAFVNAGLLKAIFSLTGWRSETTRLLTGEYIPELRMVGFRTSESLTEGSHHYV